MRKLNVDWIGLEAAQQHHGALTGFHYYFDTETAAVILLTEEAMLAAEEGQTEGGGEELEAALKMLEDPGRYVSVPARETRDDYRLMEDFIDALPDEALQRRLERAIEGRGAFRMFRAELQDDGRYLNRWYNYKQRQEQQALVDWLATLGIEPTNLLAEPEGPEPAEAPDDGGADGGEALLRDLTLACIYLSSWEERGSRRAWKGHRFEVLDALEQDDLIDQGGRKARSLHLTERGERAALELLKRLRS